MLTAECGLEDREVALLLDEDEDSEIVKGVLAEAAKLVKKPEVRPRFMEDFAGG